MYINNDIYYNANGVGSFTSIESDDIYIECKPTDYTTTSILTTQNTTPNTQGNAFSTTGLGIFYIVIFVLLFLIVLFYLGKGIYNHYSKSGNMDGIIGRFSSKKI
jgi:hypothetical protein